MPTELMISPPATGKTTACIQRVRAVLAAKPLARVWVILPDQLQVSAFKRRLARAGGALGARVATFPFLYRHLLQSCGKDVPHAGTPLVHRILQQVVDEAAADGQLRYFAPLQNMPGFIQSLRESFAELKNGMVKPEDFSAAADGASRATRELALLYARFQEKVRNLGMADQQGYAWLAIKELEDNPVLASSIDLLVVDGFDSFSPAQQHALRWLAGSARNTLITLTGAVPFTRAVHRHYEKDGNLFLEMFGAAVPAGLRQPALPPDILRLEQNLFEGHSGRMVPAGQLELVEAQSPAEEAREALRWIKMRVVRDGLQPADCAVFYPATEEYRQGLKACAAEFGIPLRFTRAEPLSQSTAVTAVLALLDLPDGGFKARGLVNLLRSPYFHYGEIADQADTFDLVYRAAQVVEGKEQWQDAWDRLANPIPDRHRDALDDEWRNPGLPRGDQAKELAKLTEAFFEMIQPQQGSQSATGWTTWLEDLLDKFGFYEQAASGQDRDAADALRECLRALVQADVIAGGKPVEFGQFVRDLRGTLDGLGLRENNSTWRNSVLAAAITEARGLRFSAVAILGLSEGTFPAVEHTDPFLGEDLRARLGLEPQLGRGQTSAFYQAVTRADQRLLLTRSYLSEKGQKQEPSAYWNDVKSHFVEKIERKVRPDDLRPQADAGSRQELLFSAIANDEPPLDMETADVIWQNLQQARSVLEQRRARLARGRYEGRMAAVAGQLTERFSADHVWNASALEKYGSCPFRFFADEVLQLNAQEEPEPGMDAAQRGSIYHAILELTYHDAADPCQVDDLLKAFKAAASQVFEAAPRRYGFRPSAVWEFEQEDILKILEKNILAMTEKAGWIPIAYELGFGSRGNPTLDIQMDEEVIHLKGKIDRVDQNGDGKTRVVDYKSGSSNGHGDAALTRGEKLQLPLYAMAVLQAGLGEPVDGIYWSLAEAKQMSLTLAKFESSQGVGLQIAEDVAVGHITKYVSDIRIGEFAPSQPKDGCPPYCPAVSWCWRNKKKGFK